MSYFELASEGERASERRRSESHSFFGSRGEISDASEPSRRAIFWRKGARWIRNDIGGLLVVFIPK